MLNNKEFGALIATRRKEIGLTQDAFAAMLGITPQAISKWENGVGYPDVTLFPHIAHALNISLDALFGTESENDDNIADAHRSTQEEPSTPPTIPGAPTTFCSLPPVAAGSHFICYSDKALAAAAQRSDLVEFTDGSTASLESGEVVNRGTGEIRMLPNDSALTAQQHAADSLPAVRHESFPYFHSLQLMGRGHATVYINISPDSQGHLEAHGNESFLRTVLSEVKEETLHLDLQPQADAGDNSNNGQVTVWFPVVAGGQFTANITGCCDVHCEPSFSHTSLTVNGCGEVHGSRTKTLIAAINGAGDIHWKSVDDNTSLTINGCGNINIDYAANPHINVNGVGDVSLRQVSGNMAATVRGSGEISAAGELESFCCHMDGSGNLRGEQLSVGEASIVITHGGTVILGRIRSHSTEQLGPEATLKVDHRGNPVGGTANLPLK